MAFLCVICLHDWGDNNPLKHHHKNRQISITNKGIADAIISTGKIGTIPQITGSFTGHNEK